MPLVDASPAPGVIPPLHVRFGSAQLWPDSLDPTGARAWLSAPIGGVPLKRRLLEPLAGLPVLAMSVTPDRAGRHAVLEDALDTVRPITDFGSFAVTGRAVAVTDLELPGCGLLDVDLRPMLGSGLAVALDLAQPDGMEAARIRVGGRAGDAICATLAGALLPTATAADLLVTARMVLEGDTEVIRVFGRFEGELLLGAGVRLGRGVEVLGTAAVGDDSTVDRGARLGLGAIVGRRCVVGAGARLEDCVVLDDCEVRPGEVLSGVVRTPTGDLAVGRSPA